MKYWDVIQMLTPLSAPPSCLYLLPQTLGPYTWPSASCESVGRAAAGSDLVHTHSDEETYSDILDR